MAKKFLFLLALLAFASPSAKAQYGVMPCYSCMAAQAQYAPSPYAAPPFFSSSYPWWSPYGSLSYSNFYAPSPWYPQQGGIPHRSYPGNHTFMAGKPNLYFEGEEGKTLSIRLTTKNGAEVMTSVPRLEGGKKVEVTLSEDHGIEHGGAVYRYFYYDIGGDSTALQATKGFCTDKANFLEALLSILHSAGFPDRSITDFREHWSVKTPNSKRFCVYPQTPVELAKVYSVDVEPALAEFKQIHFVVVPDEWRSKKQPYFSKIPAEGWKNPYTKSAKTGVRGYEWAVTFLVLMN